MNAHKCDGCRYKGEHVEMGFKPFGVCYKETNLIEAEKNYNSETCPYKQNIFITNAGLDINAPYKTPYDDKIAEAARMLSGEEKPAYLPQLYEIEGVDLAEPEEWAEEKQYIKPDQEAALQEGFEMLVQGLQKMRDLLAPAFAVVVEEIGKIAQQASAVFELIAETCETTCETIIEQYPNKRVIYLAKHGKRRTRKKNINRILKYFEREGKKRAEFAP